MNKYIEDLRLLQSSLVRKTIFKTYNKTALDIGAGDKQEVWLPDSVTMDICDYPGIDIIQDIEDAPWLIEDNQFELIRAQHILEHIKDGIAFINILNEVWRVGKPGAIFVGEVPRHDSPNFFRDPTHVRPMSEHSFDMFLEGSKIHAGDGYGIRCTFRKHKLYVNSNRDVVWRLEVIK